MHCAETLYSLGGNLTDARVALISSHTARVIFMQLACSEIGYTLISVNGSLNSGK